ncbi:MAG: hypothetical protein AAGK02_09745 [Pseudomonadota bacterium]
MQTLLQNPAAAYRKVDLEARIEASAVEDLTRICLEEAVAALRQAELASANGAENAARDPLSRAHAIVLWLARGVADDNPLRQPLLQFYGGQALEIQSLITRPTHKRIAAVCADFSDLFDAAKAV